MSEEMFVCLFLFFFFFFFFCCFFFFFVVVVLLFVVVVVVVLLFFVVFFFHVAAYISIYTLTQIVFVCVEALRASQPNGVMSSAVSLPNRTFTGQAQSSKRLTSIVYILWPETDNCPS